MEGVGFSYNEKKPVQLCPLGCKPMKTKNSDWTQVFA